MRKLGVLLLALILLAALLYRWIEQDRVSSSSKTVPPPPTEAEPSEPTLVPPPADVLRVPSDETRRMPASAPPTVTVPLVECTVSGRVVDENGRGLAGVNVRLDAYRVWAEGVDVPRLPGKYDMRGWELPTELDGSFRFATPVPTAQMVVLTIEPDPFHDSAREYFGGGDSDSRAPLHAGDNDLGVFRLVVTGALRGTVRDEAGRPLENSNLRVANDRATTLERESDSDASGGYLIEHVKPGSFGVNAECEGYLSEFRKPFQVEAGRVTEGVDFVLRVAPTLSGVVVDEQGRGLAGAKLWGWPSSSGAGAGAKSDADGSFTIHLPQDEPYTLEVELDGFDTFGLDDLETHYAPGTGELRIVMKRSVNALTRFVVTDAVSHATIERFGIEIERDQGSAAARSGWTDYRADPRPSHHPGGELSLAARPGLDCYTVVATGYVRASGDVQHESEVSSRQVIALQRGGSLQGRVTTGGAPVAGAAVRLEAGRVEESGARPAFRADRITTLTTSTDEDGRFRFDALEPGTYRLVIRSADGEFAEVVPVQIGPSGDADLGDLVLVPGATITGQVLVPPGRSAGGLIVYLDDWREDVTQPTDAQGRFRFGGLPAGEHTLDVGEVPGALAGDAAEHVTLVAGETRAVVIDARDRGTCNVVLTIELTGTAPEGLEVTLLPVADPKKRITLGTTDANGRVAGWARATGDAWVEIALERTRLRHPTALILLELDRDVGATVRFEVGGVLIEFPSSVRLASDGSGSLELQPEPSNAGGAVPFRVSFSGDGARTGATTLADGRRLQCEIVPAGRYHGVLALYAKDAPLDRLDDGTGIRHERRAFFKTDFAVDVGAGKTVEIRLP